MVKRIGSKIYDTDKAILVLEPDLYKKINAFEFFRFNGKTITPIDFETAQKEIIDSNNQEAINHLSRKRDKQGNTHVAISAASADRLSAYCRQHHVTQKKVIEDFIETLEV